MNNSFLVIVITSEVEVADEARKITRLLDAGVDYVHIRKPNSTLRDVKNLIENIPFRLRSRLKLHGHFDLLNDMNLGGVHLNSRNPHAPSAANSISKSCHSLYEAENSAEFDYVTLSPVFDSISKPGYNANKELSMIKKDILKNKKIVALGGIRPENFKFLKKSGFYGAALLGYIWNGDFNKNIRELESIIKSTSTKNL